MVFISYFMFFLISTVLQSQTQRDHQIKGSQQNRKLHIVITQNCLKETIKWEPLWFKSMFKWTPRSLIRLIMVTMKLNSHKVLSWSFYSFLFFVVYSYFLGVQIFRVEHFLMKYILCGNYHNWELFGWELSRWELSGWEMSYCCFCTLLRTISRIHI